jgi:hypothetical protein
VNVDELYASFEALIEANRPGRDDVVYLERRGNEYEWWIVRAGEAITESQKPDKPEPDAWMSFSADWPVDPKRLRAFFGDLLAELESMATRADRCRWPIGEPWPHVH